MEKIQKKKILIRCLTIPEKGFGHLSRCLIIYKELKRKGFYVEFLIDDNSDAENILEKKNIVFTTFSQKRNHTNKYKNILKILKDGKFIGIILDMREFNDVLSKKIFHSDYKTIVIDDAWGKNAYADLIINVTMIDDYHKYTKFNKNSKLLLGTKYYIIEQKFANNRKKIIDVKEKKYYRITITMGGSEPNCFTLKMLKPILEIPNIIIDVIWGPFFEDSQEMEKIAKENKNVNLIKSSLDLLPFFKKSDIVISNGGNTIFELITIGIPTISIAMHKHQIPYLNYFRSKGLTKYVGYWKESKKSKVKEELNGLLKSVKIRRNMNAFSKKFLDGKGTKRTVKEIIECLKN